VKNVLIVEDDLMIADMLEEVLVLEGFQVCGIARSPNTAIALAEQHHPDLAIVDVHLVDNGLGTDVACELVKRYQTGILYTTGNVEAVTHAAGHACLPKPFRLRDAAKALKIVIELIEHGSMTATPPEGLVLLNYAAA
jgi:two-component system, response regulator PdtaR